MVYLKGFSPQCIFFVLMASCSLENPYKDGVTFYKHLASPQSHIPMYTTSGLSSGKCNMVLSFNKSLCKILQWCIAFMMFMNANANFTWFCCHFECCLCASYLTFVLGAFPPTQWCLGCDSIFQFAPYAPHHNHLDCPYQQREHIHYAWNP